MSANNSTLDEALKSARLEREQLEIENLRETLIQGKGRKSMFETTRQASGLVTAAVAALGFLFSIGEYAYQQQQNRGAQAKQSTSENETAERELMKPWLESQRRIYTDALAAVATIANTDDPAKRKEATNEFWALYQGPMILVETQSVSGAMVQFGNCLDVPDRCGKNQMNSLSRALGTAMADSMGETARMTFAQFQSNQFKYDVDYKGTSSR
jgi:hypothetical protein